MAQSSNDRSKNWLDLSEAAEMLGVHFTTLRRWADAGEIEYMRTPGGRRRFKVDAVLRFLQNRQITHLSNLSTDISTRLVAYTHQELQTLPDSADSWMVKFTSDQRMQFRQTGNRFTALLMQYASREVNGDTFLEEAKRIAVEYGNICYRAGLTITQTLRAFMFFQRSILDAVHETGFLGEIGDSESQQLYQRTSVFFDEVLLVLVNQYFVVSRITV